MRVFLSHSQQDEAVYTTLCMALDAAGIALWDPATMASGDSLAEQLRSAISECELCIFLGTRRSIESKWCLAELGAFWGVGKRVIIFLADPDLTDDQLPLQFKGNLRTTNAQRLVRDINNALKDNASALSDRYEFYSASGSYGTDTDWAKILSEASSHIDILGVALTGWRTMNNSSRHFLDRAEAGCKIRILLMSEENSLLGGLLLENKKSLDSVARDIKESFVYYSELARQHKNIEVRKITRGMPHFFLTLTDRSCLVIQYTSSTDWGNGPTWVCQASSELYNTSAREFNHLWSFGTGDGKLVS